MRITFDNGTQVHADTVADAAEFVRLLFEPSPTAPVPSWAEEEQKAFEQVAAYAIPNPFEKVTTADEEDRRWKEAADVVKKKRGRKPSVGLSPALAEIHEYLVDNDSPEGVTRVDLANAFGIKVPAMDQRLRQLKKRGLANQSSRGYWRYGA